MDLEFEERKSTITESKSQFGGQDHHLLIDQRDLVHAESFSVDDGALLLDSKH